MPYDVYILCNFIANLFSEKHDKGLFVFGRLDPHAEPACFLDAAHCCYETVKVRVGGAPHGLSAKSVINAVDGLYANSEH